MESKKKRKAVTRKAAMLSLYQGSPSKSIQVDTDIFKGMKFVIMSDPKSREGENDRKLLSDMVRRNGGTCVKIAKSQPDLFIVYGGKTIPYDLKLLMDKDSYDVLKPVWITESVTRRELLPLQKRHFFHATKARSQTPAYQDTTDDAPEVPEVLNALEPNIKEEYNDPAFADWFKLSGISVSKVEIIGDEQHSETDPESVEDEGTDFDWFKVEGPQGEQSLSVDDSSTTMTKLHDSYECVKMGETDTAMEYDQQNIFKHLCFYLDNPKNARANGQSVSSEHAEELSKRFEIISSMIQVNGGRVVDIDDPKLTHVVIDKLDDSRRLDLMKRTSKPKRRYVVVSEYIKACLDEQTLLNEEEFAP